MLGGASLNNLAAAWVSRWGLGLDAMTQASILGFVLLLPRTQSCLFHNPYPQYVRGSSGQYTPQVACIEVDQFNKLQTSIQGINFGQFSLPCMVGEKM